VEPLEILPSSETSPAFFVKMVSRPASRYYRATEWLTVFIFRPLTGK
jgi:hypothetical protein